MSQTCMMQVQYATVTGKYFRALSYGLYSYGLCSYGLCCYGIWIMAYVVMACVGMAYVFIVYVGLGGGVRVVQESGRAGRAPLHNYTGHNYTGHNYIDRKCISHNYTERVCHMGKGPSVGLFLATSGHAAHCVFGNPSPAWHVCARLSVRCVPMPIAAKRGGRVVQESGRAGRSFLAFLCACGRARGASVVWRRHRRRGR